MDDLQQTYLNYFRSYEGLLAELKHQVYLSFAAFDEKKPGRLIEHEDYSVLELNMKYNYNHLDTITAYMYYIGLEKIRIETDRLIIRRYTRDDLDDVYEIASNPNVTLPDGFKPRSSKQELAEAFNFYLDGSLFALEQKDTHKVIGGITLKNNTSRAIFTIEIGYDINQAYWRQGYAYEGCYAMMDYLFTKLHVNMMNVTHFKDNEASKALINKLGFTYEGILRNAFSHNVFGAMDLVSYSITSDEWQKQKGRQFT